MTRRMAPILPSTRSLRRPCSGSRLLAQAPALRLDFYYALAPDPQEMRAGATSRALHSGCD